MTTKALLLLAAIDIINLHTLLSMHSLFIKSQDSQHQLLPNRNTVVCHKTNKVLHVLTGKPNILQ